LRRRDGSQLNGISVGEALIEITAAERERR
jgi:hypothetical protein